MSKKKYDYKFHRYCTIYPERAHLIEDLAKSIAEIGQIEDIVLADKVTILEGRHRYLACLKAGVVPRFRFFGDLIGDGKDMLQYVIAKNSHRRDDMTMDDKKEVARTALIDRPEWSDSKIGLDSKLSPTTVAKLRAELVKDGKIKTATQRVDKNGRPLKTEGIGRKPSKKNTEGSTARTTETLPAGSPARDPEEAGEHRPHQRDTIDSINAIILENDHPAAGHLGDSTIQAATGSGKTIAEPPADKVVEDALGQPVPAHLRDSFNDTFYERVADQVNAWIVHVRSHAAIYPRLIEKGGFSSILKALVDCVAGCSPHSICPNCKGDAVGMLDCPHCFRSGFLSQHQYFERKRQEGGE